LLCIELILHQDEGGAEGDHEGENENEDGIEI
jgi:hypothetical protein